MSWGTNDERATREYLIECEKEWSREVVRNYEFVMVLKETGKVIGGCGLYLSDDRRQALLGWILHRDYWKNGLTPEAGRAMIDYGFSTLGLHRIHVTCDAQNYGSRRVMEKLGMRREAEFKKVCLCHGEWHDKYEYGILEEEWNVEY